MKKRLLTLALAAAMLTTTGVTAFAANITQDNTNGSTRVQYSVNAQYYTVVIPDTVTLSKDSDISTSIEIYGVDSNSNVVIPSTKKVNVALSDSLNGFKVKTDNGDELAYKVNGKNTAKELTSVAECAAAAKSETPLTFSKIDENAIVYSGDYSDTLTFTVSLVNA